MVSDNEEERIIKKKPKTSNDTVVEDHVPINIQEGADKRVLHKIRAKEREVSCFLCSAASSGSNKMWCC